MIERESKVLLLVESLLCLVPVTLVTLLYAIALLRMNRSGLGAVPWGALAVNGFVFLGLALQLCGWRVIAAFLIDGRKGLRQVSSAYIYAIVLGAGLVVLSVGVVLLMQLDIELPDFVGLLMVNYVAFPALIPFTHVMFERRRGLRVPV